MDGGGGVGLHLDAVGAHDLLHDVAVGHVRPGRDLFFEAHQHAGIHAADVEERVAGLAAETEIDGGDVAVEHGLEAVVAVRPRRTSCPSAAASPPPPVKADLDR